MTAPKDWLLEAKERCAKATPEPWTARKVSKHKGRILVEEDGRFVETVAEAYCGAMEGHGEENAEFIASSRTDLPRAIAALEAADRLADWLDTLFQDIGEYQREKDAEGEFWNWPREADLTQLHLRSVLAAYLAARHGAASPGGAK